MAGINSLKASIPSVSSNLSKKLTTLLEFGFLIKVKIKKQKRQVKS